MEVFDVVIIGGGPAGCAAAVYVARKELKTLLLTDYFGGQSIISGNIHNWIGEMEISGIDLAKKLEAQVRAYSKVVEVVLEKAVSVKNISTTNKNRFCDFEVRTGKDLYIGKTVIVASGARRRKLGILGEDKLIGKGVAYCSTCDAPLFVGKKVVVVGGGNAGLEAAADLFPYASEVYLIHRGDALKGDPVEQEKIKNNPKLKEIILNTEIAEIVGDSFVSGIKYKNSKTGEEQILPVEEVFVEIGSEPNSEIVKDLVDLDKWGQVIIDAKHATTSHPGIFAAGDVTDDPYKQNNISAGDAVKATLAAYAYLLNREKQAPAAETLNH